MLRPSGAWTRCDGPFAGVRDDDNPVLERRVIVIASAYVGQRDIARGSKPLDHKRSLDRGWWSGRILEDHISHHRRPETEAGEPSDMH